MWNHARLRAPQLALDEQGGRLRLDALELHAVVRVAFALQLDPVEARDEVDVPPVAAELAVGDGRQAEVLLQLHHLADQAVFGFLQLFRISLARPHLFTEVMQLMWTEQAADVVGAERGFHQAVALLRQPSW